MTYALFAIMYMQLQSSSNSTGGDFLYKAQTEFDKSYDYTYGGFNSWAECASGSCTPHFTTGQGAFLQSIVNGWAGVRYLTDGAMSLTPQMPLDGTKNLTIAGIHFRRSSLTLSILASHAVVTLSMGSPIRIVFTPPHAVQAVEKLLDQGDFLDVKLGKVVTCQDVPVVTMRFV